MATDPDTTMSDIPAASTSTSTSTSSPFEKVPLEVLLRITYFLTTPELGNVRLTCRSIEQSLYTTFTNEFFTRKQFMISRTSLQALIDISKSRLGGHLRKVHFGTDRFAHPLQANGHNARTAKQIQLYNSQFQLLSTGGHVVMLAEAFKTLSNLEDIVIRDFNSNRRSRDGYNKHWTSYGSTTAFRETGERPGQSSGPAWGPDTATAYGSTIFASVLCALEQVNARPKGIEHMSRSKNHLQDCAFEIPPEMLPSVTPVLENLEKLHIDIDLLGGNDFSSDDAAGHSPNADMNLREFLLKLKNIRHLRINETHSSVTGPGMLLKWLGEDSSPTNPSPEYPYIEELNFGMMNVEPQHLIAVAQKFAPSLKRLELHKVTLRRRLPDGHTGGGTLPKVNFWNKFLGKLKEIPGLDLRHIRVSMPQQQWISRVSRVYVSFEDANFCQYTGTDWKHFVEHEMMPKVAVQRPHDESVSDDGEESDGIWDQYAFDL